MVLENASDSTASFEENAPSSDADPYSSSESSIPATQQYNIDATKLPQPFPVLGPLFGYDTKYLAKVLKQRLQSKQGILGRPPTQDEATATAYWIAKQMSTQSYGEPLGLAAGFWRAQSTTSTFRFPFWQPNLETFNPTVFPSGKMPLVCGNRAVNAWHIARYLTYGFIGMQIAQILFGSYSATVAVVGELSDPRLKEVVKAINERSKRKAGALPNVGQPGAIPQQNGRVGMGRQPVDDASPTADRYGDPSAGNGDALVGNTSDDNVQQEEHRRRQWPRTSKPAPPMDTRETPEKSFSEFDDASSTGGQGTRADIVQPQGSAWDRVRQGAVSKPAGQTSSSWPKTNQNQQPSGESAWARARNNARQGPQDGSHTDDNFTISKSEEERSYARSEAQKEFDAKVERERRGGDFSSGGTGDRRRW